MNDSWAERLEREYGVLLTERDALREQVRVLQDAIFAHGHQMNELMKGPSTYERGRAIARLVTELEDTARLLAQTAETEAMTDPSVMACGCLQDERCDYHKAFRIAELRAMGVIPNDK